MKITQQISKEVIKSSNLGYYADNHAKVTTYSGPKNLNDEQKLSMLLVHHHRQITIVSDRASGKTMGGLLAAYHYAVYHSNATVAIIGRTLNDASYHRNVINLYDTEPFSPCWLSGSISNTNKHEIDFLNGSRIIFLSSNSLHRMRGQSINFVFADDMDVWTAQSQSDLIVSFWPIMGYSKSYFTMGKLQPNSYLYDMLNAKRSMVYIEF